MKNSMLLLLITGIFLISPYAGELDSINSKDLKFCISYYHDGYYNRVIDCIHDVLPELKTLSDSIESYKMLALSYGMINQIDKAKECFSIALGKDSTMSIDTLAFPPNVSLIYNQVKLEKKMSRIETTPQPKPVVVYKKKKSAGPALLLTSVVLSAGGAGYLYYKGFLARKVYFNSKTQSTLDQSWKEYTYSMAEGAGCTVVAGVATWLFFRVNKKNSAVSVSGWGNGLALVCQF